MKKNISLKDIHKAAEQGNAAAQFNLGMMYYEGGEVSQDYAEAAKWLLKAAEQGIATAQYNLAEMYQNGLGIPQDYTEAVKWYRSLRAGGCRCPDYTGQDVHRRQRRFAGRCRDRQFIPQGSGAGRYRGPIQSGVDVS